MKELSLKEIKKINKPNKLALHKALHKPLHKYVGIIIDIDEVFKYIRSAYNVKGDCRASRAEIIRNIPYVLQIQSTSPISTWLSLIDQEYPRHKYHCEYICGDVRDSYEHLKEIALDMIESQFIFKKSIMFQHYDNKTFNKALNKTKTKTNNKRK